MTEICLPELPQPVNSLTQTDLRTIIPNLVRYSTGRERTLYNKDDCKPKWWPRDIPWRNIKYDTRERGAKKRSSWTEVLRDLVRRCYKYHQQEKFLLGPSKAKPADNKISVKSLPAEKSSCTGLKNGHPLQERNTQLQTPIMGGFGLETKVQVPVSGPIPAGTYLWKGSLPEPLQQSLQPTESATLPTSQITSVGRAKSPENELDDDYDLKEVYICFFCEKEFVSQTSLQAHNKECTIKKAKEKVRQQKLTLCVTPPRNTRNTCYDQPVKKGATKQFASLNYKKHDKPFFVKALGLVPQSKAAAIIKESQDKEIDCEIIDVEEAMTPKTPTTPRTPKSLMSQLSRDMSPPASARRLLSISEVPELKPLGGGNSDAESDGKSETGEEDSSTERQYALFKIDLCSPLGLRVKNHMHVDDKENNNPTDITLKEIDSTNSNREKVFTYEAFCHTPKKDQARERLRHRPPAYPVTYRKSRRHRPAYVHTFKFSRSALREHVRKCETGLNKRGRMLKRQMKKCSVNITRLSKNEVKKWASKPRSPWHGLQRLSGAELAKYLSSKNIVLSPSRAFPQGPTLLCDYQSLQRMLGLKTAITSPVKKLSLAQMISEDLSAEAVSQKLTLYKSLLADNKYIPSNITPPLTPQRLTIVSSPGSKNLPYVLDCNQNTNLVGPLSTSPSTVRLSVSSPTHQVNKPGIHATSFYKKNFDLSVKKQKKDQDVICISSDEEEEPVKKKPKLAEGSSSQKTSWHTVLFKCHLCHEEIHYTKESMNIICNHFAAVHGIRNLHLLEQKDEKGNKIVSIVEDRSPSTQKNRLLPNAAESQRPLSSGGRKLPGRIMGPKSAQIKHQLRQRAIANNRHSLESSSSVSVLQNTSANRQLFPNSDPRKKSNSNIKHPIGNKRIVTGSNSDRIENQSIQQIRNAHSRSLSYNTSQNVKTFSKLGNMSQGIQAQRRSLRHQNGPLKVNDNYPASLKRKLGPRSVSVPNLRHKRQNNRSTGCDKMSDDVICLD